MKALSILVITAIFMMTTIVMVGQSVVSQEVDLELQNQTLEDAIWMLSDLADFPFSFSGKDIDQKKININVSATPINVILDRLLEGTYNYYEEVDGQLYILKNYLDNLTLSGYVEDAATGERLIGATIYNTPSHKGTTTNNFGFFSLQGDVKDTLAVISYIGYEPVYLHFRDVLGSSAVIKMRPDNDLPEITILAGQNIKQKSNLNHQRDLMEKYDLTQVSSIGGEQDVMQLIYQLPGATTGTDGLGGLHVRGGNADQNLIMLDGVQIYNPYHSFGLFSIFDNNTISSVEYIKGAFPARFGGRISSVLDIRLKNGNSKEWSSKVSVGLLATKAMVEGPIIKDKLSFLFNARQTHFNPIFKKDSWRGKLLGSEDSELGYNFGDVVSKLTYTPSEDDRFYLSYYNGNDTYNKSITEIDTFLYTTKEQARQRLAWGNQLIVGRWNHQYSENLFSNLTVNYSRFNFDSEDFIDFSNEEYLNLSADTFSLASIYNSKIEKLTGKLEIEYIPTNNHYIRAGITLADNTYQPGVSIVRNEEDDTPIDIVELKSEEVNLYLEDEWKINESVVANFGLFSSMFDTEGKKYYSIEPRLSILWRASEKLLLGGSANKVTQNLHVLSRDGAGFPTDLWVPSTSLVRPQSAWQYDLSADYNFSPSNLLSVSMFRKNMNDIITYREVLNFNTVGSNSLLNSENWQQNVTSGAGIAYGIEMIAEKRTKSYLASISYSWTKSERQFELVNEGIAFPFKFEHRHKVNLNYSKTLSRKWKMNLQWNYNSGSRINIPLSKWQYIREDGNPDFFYYDVGEKNSYQLPAYHRFDCSFVYQKPTSYGDFKMIWGVYNLYNRKNSYSINAEFRAIENDLNYKNVSIIPVLPFFSFQFSFFKKQE